MLRNLSLILQHNCGLDLQRPIIVGVSGGADSLYLLDMLWERRYSLVVVHINHQIRSTAEMDERITREAAKSRGLEFHVHHVDVPGFASQRRIAIEEAARILRYEMLFAEAAAVNAQAIAVGHTADDQVETVLMHLLRGAGTAGMRGMRYRLLPNPWSGTIPLVRPLLGIWRQDISAHLAHQGIVPAADETNQDIQYQRNRIRHELVPLLESYNPSIRKAVARLAEILQGDDEIITLVVDSAWASMAKVAGEEYVCLDRVAFHQYPHSLQRQLIRRAAAHLSSGLKDLDFDAVERALSFLERRRPGQVDLVGGITLQVIGDTLWLVGGAADPPFSAFPQLAPGDKFTLAVPGEIRFSSGWSLKAAQAARGVKIDEATPGAAWSACLDGARLATSLQVRGRLPGDTFRPAGMGGHRTKVSDFMINVKIPHRVRQGWPLVVSGDEIVWIPGYRVAEGYEANPATPQPVLFEILHQS
jgi:tRNA(Ile)-lysidine synthase